MKYVGAIDQGTTSTRFIIFNEEGSIVATSQIEHRQIYPKPGWVEHDPEEIWNNTCFVIRDALRKAGLEGREIAAIGITNQRETVVAIDRNTGKPYYNAIVWQDLRGSQLIDRMKGEVPEERIREKTGLLYSPYFSASKIKWLIDNVPAVKKGLDDGSCIFATIDSYLIYRLTGGRRFCTDATNASRYMLMDISTLSWDDGMLSLFGIPRSSLPEIVSSSGTVYGMTEADGPLGAEVPVAGDLGDQQAALFGQVCFEPGESKCTYGTGCFMLANTGKEICLSDHGLLTTVACRIEGEEPDYALEGSVAVAGSLVQWTRDSLKMVDSAKELDELASSVPDNAGVYIVPAFSGLFAPYWRSDARGVIAGLTGFATRAHICRAVLEATAFQAYDIFSAMEMDSGIKLKNLKVDGGMTNSWPLMEFQSDILQVPVIRPLIVETTSLGAAYAAGLTVGVWKDRESLRRYWKEQLRWTPTMDDKERQKKVGFWKKAVSRTLGWVSADKE
ncbi:MAG: glycerol kinase GlpK [Candidatus Ornithospirochaeta sp.]|nr:glycerol kinase GlpK [Candidatus Ornithospirochaeta sp.]